MRIRLTTRGVLACYAAWMALLVTLHYALPGLRTEAAPLIDLTAAAAIADRRLPSTARPGALPWFMLAAANLTGALGRLPRTSSGR